MHQFGVNFAGSSIHNGFKVMFIGTEEELDLPSRIITRAVKTHFRNRHDQDRIQSGQRSIGSPSLTESSRPLRALRRIVHGSLLVNESAGNARINIPPPQTAAISLDDCEHPVVATIARIRATWRINRIMIVA